MTVAYSNSQTRYNAGDWVYTEHPTKVWYERDSQVIEAHIPYVGLSNVGPCLPN